MKWSRTIVKIVHKQWIDNIIYFGWTRWIRIKLFSFVETPIRDRGGAKGFVGKSCSICIHSGVQTGKFKVYGCGNQYLITKGSYWAYR